ncbi:MAG: hypothetical protein ACXW6T_08975 [Candidatus Binatia bacterium]
MLRLEHRTLVGVTLGLFIPSQALAYVDPGTSGLISQVLYVMFYGALAVFFYFLRYIKSWIARVKTSLAGLFGRNP